MFQRTIVMISVAILVGALVAKHLGIIGKSKPIEYPAAS